jgi:SAM-dependent methyltransferase
VRTRASLRYKGREVTSATGEPYNAAGTGTATLELLESAVRYNSWLAAKLTPFLGENNLELGAGHGTLTALVATKRNVVASEPSGAGRAVLLQRFASHPRVSSIIADLAELPAVEAFDCVYSVNVLEHVADDVALVKRSADVLRPGGHFVAIVPAGDWLYSSFDAAIGHHRRYGHADRVRLSAELASGDKPLKLVAYRTFNPVGALAWFLRMRLLKRSRIPAADLERFDQMVPLLQQLDRVPCGFGQNLLLSFVRCP